MAQHPPIFNVPRIVTLAVLFLIAIHLGLQLLSPETDDWWLLAMAFIPARFGALAAELPGGEIARYTSFLTHMLVHGDGLHLMFNVAWLLAFGGALAKRMATPAFVAFSLCCGVAGALAFWVINLGLPAPMVGASGALSGMMGAVLRLLFGAADRGEVALLRSAPWAIPLTPLASALRDRRLWLVTGIWVAVNMLAVAGFGAANGGIIAWEAHVGGFIFGVLAYGWFDFRKCEQANHAAEFPE